MSIKKKLFTAYLGLVILPIVMMLGTLRAMTNFYSDQIGEVLHQIDYQLKQAAYTSVFEKLQADQVADPTCIANPEYLKAFFETQTRVVHFQVKLGDLKIFEADRSENLPEKSLDQLQEKDIQLRSGNDLYQVNLKFLPLNLLEGGQDIKAIFEDRVSLGILVFISLHMVFVIFVAKYFLKPINQLKTVAEHVGQKNYDFEIDTRRKDEIGDTFRAFDDMRRSIRTYEANRKELIANISHDLKTPITAIRGYITAIQDGMASSPETLERYLKIMNKNVTHLDQMVDDLLLHSKLDVDQVTFDFQPIALEKYLDYLVDDIRLELENKSVDVYWDSHQLENVVCLVDVFKLRRVLLNIVDNGVKHLNKPEKSIRIWLEKEGNEGVIYIKDNGKGIHPEDLPNVFERFYRADSSRNTEIGGSGLGLAICKQILDKHGASIRMTSELGVYTCVEIRIPLIENVQPLDV